MVDMRVRLGPLELATPIVAASGTFGHGAEVAALCDPSKLGAVTAKSQAIFAWSGSPAPRLHPAAAGMLNAVGLEGHGVDRWIAEDLRALRACRAHVIASIWGREVEDFARAAAKLRGADVVAVEVNLSCPNVEHQLFAHDPDATNAVVGAVVRSVGDRPVFAKLSPNATDIVAIASAARSGGATGLTLINTVLGLAVDAESRLPILGRGGGGLSGPAIKPIALRVVREVHLAHPDLPIIGTGGVTHAEDAAEMLLAGATAVGVGTATFADPRAPLKIARGLERWCRRHGVRAVGDLTGALRDQP